MNNLQPNNGHSSYPTTGTASTGATGNSPSSSKPNLKKPPYPTKNLPSKANLANKVAPAPHSPQTQKLQAQAQTTLPPPKPKMPFSFRCEAPTPQSADPSHSKPTSMRTGTRETCIHLTGFQNANHSLNHSIEINNTNALPETLNFSDLFSGKKEDYAKVIQRRTAFLKELSSLDTNEQFANYIERKLERFNQEEITLICHILLSRGRYGDIARILNTYMEHKDIEDYNLRKMYLTAYIKYPKQEMSEENKKYLLNEINELKKLSESNPFYALHELIALEGLVHENYKDIDQARILYEKAFALGGNPLIGEKILNMLVEKANRVDPQSQIECKNKITQFASLLHVALLNHGGIESNSLQQHLCLLKIYTILPSTATHPKLIEFSLGKISELSKSDPERVKNPYIAELKSFQTLFPAPAIQDAIEILAEKKSVASVPMKEIHLWKGCSFNYKGLKRDLMNGNFRWNGLLPDYGISMADEYYFKQLLNKKISDLISCPTNSPKDEELYKKYQTMALKDIEHIEDFNRLTTLFTRENFKTDTWQLENDHSLGHKKFDTYFAKLTEAMGFQSTTKQWAPSLTNLSLSLAIGLGDCRHHAQVKQLLFDVWQKEKINQHLTKAMSYFKHSKPERQAEAIQACHEILNTELRTIDFSVFIPKELKLTLDANQQLSLENSRPQYTWDSAETGTNRWDHTFHILITYDPKSNHISNDDTQTIETVDSFCLANSQVGGWRITDRIKIDKNKVELEVPTVEMVDANQQVQSIKLKTESTPYSGARNKFNPLGDALQFWGHQINYQNFKLEEHVVKDHRSKRDQSIENFLK